MSGGRTKVSASIRFVREGIAGRWRPGVVIGERATVYWRPRRPRLGQRIRVDDGQLLSTRKPSGPDWLWLHSAAEILVVRLDDETVELAVAPGDQGPLRRALRT